MRKHRTKLSIKELFSLNVGDQFRVYYAKDDDPNYIRCNYEVQTIEIKNPGDILTKEGFNWYLQELKPTMSIDDNVLDTSRGYAYFYKK